MKAQSVEDWAARVFQTLLFNLLSPSRKCLSDFGLDWERVQAEMLEAFTDDISANARRSADIFRVLIKRYKTGIIPAHQTFCCLCEYG